MNTHVTFVLDSSGSMSSIREDTIGGFNTFLHDLGEDDEGTTVTLYEFNDEVERIYRGQTLEAASELDTSKYVPGGQTALHDAITQAISDTEQFLGEREALDVNVVVVVLTDGQENASETPASVIRRQIEAKQASGWEFLFIGANQDAALTAGEFGINRQNSLSMAHTDEGARAAYESTSDRIQEVRNTGSTEGFDGADRERQQEAEQSNTNRSGNQ